MGSSLRQKDLCNSEGTFTNHWVIFIFFGSGVSWDVGGTVDSESALRSAGSLLILLRVRAPPPAPWPDGESNSLGSSCCGLAICKNQNPTARFPC
ncbi:hypothetical protein PoB_006873000 [Plakobranchus ocellatus]|uniref:Uncharacterized protein n=1 Tax=Plakobranchus ocellatus TaxID=259542 RepID=A0AAV4DE66_9GAST|nr:hypothetical protein PoB_006873000 [Plakobranchus ocellatus]